MIKTSVRTGIEYEDYETQKFTNELYI